MRDAKERCFNRIIFIILCPLYLLRIENLFIIVRRYFEYARLLPGG